MNGGKRRRFIVLLTMMLLLLTLPVTAQAAKKGLVQKNGKIYCYQNGKRVRNKMKKVKGNWYYFKADGQAATDHAGRECRHRSLKIKVQK